METLYGGDNNSTVHYNKYTQQGNARNLVATETGDAALHLSGKGRAFMPLWWQNMSILLCVTGPQELLIRSVCVCVCAHPLTTWQSLSCPDIVHENLKMGSDGESDQASGTSSDDVQSPTGVCLRNRVHRRISMEVRHTHTLPPWQQLGRTFYLFYQQ